jgi:hypothetical protein
MPMHRRWTHTGQARDLDNFFPDETVGISDIAIRSNAQDGLTTFQPGEEKTPYNLDCSGTGNHGQSIVETCLSIYSI